MATFSDLTPEQQGIVAEYTRQQRAMVGAFARLLNQFEALDNMFDGPQGSGVGHAGRHGRDCRWLRAGWRVAIEQGRGRQYRHGGAGNSDHVLDRGAAAVVRADGRDGQHALALAGGGVNGNH